MKLKMLVLGVFWSGGLLTAHALNAVDISKSYDFFVGVFGGCCTGLGLSKQTIQAEKLGPLEKDKDGFY